MIRIRKAHPKMVEREAVLEGHAWMRDTRFLGACMPLLHVDRFM